MRKPALLSVLFLLPAWGLGQELAPTPQLCGHAKQTLARMRAAYSGARVGQPQLEGATDNDVLHYDLDIELKPTTKWLGGSNTMTVRSLVPGLTVFRFRLHSDLAISALSVGGSPANWVRLDTATIEVTLDRPYDPGEEFVVYVAYAGYPQSGGTWGSIIFRTRNGHPEVYTLSEPWYAYTWWPCKDDLADKTTADLWFTVPVTMVVASNGLLQGVDPVGSDKARYRWKTEYPTEDYLYCIGATNYDQFDAVWTYGGNEMALRFYIYPESNNQSNREKWLKCSEALTVFSDLYGLYPFVDEKYGMLQFGWSGGMEHQTMTSIGGFWEYIVVHELSHQWWGDFVTCATWHDIWLNEGFATYSEALYYENRPGSSGEPALHSYMATRRPGDPSGTVYCYDISDPDRIFDYDLTYLKASWVLHMLRHVVGKVTFYDILVAYRSAFGGAAATTEDFQNVAESVSGRDLAWFFDEWVYGPGAPAYNYAWRQYVLDGRPYVELFVRQGQPGSWPAFTMPVDLQITDGSESYTHVVWNDARREHLLFPVARPGVTNVVFDPKPWILWTARNSISFEEGPPKIVTMDPAPGATIASTDLNRIEVVFHKDVVVDQSKLSLVGAYHGSPAMVFAYDPQRHAATLTPVSPLPSDTYTLTVADTIVDVASGTALDGELAKPDGPEPLPSGDGVPGGSAITRLAVTVPGDLNCDGAVDFGDINPFVMAILDWEEWKLQHPECPEQNADINGDGQYGGPAGFGDINPFVRLLSNP